MKDINVKNQYQLGQVVSFMEKHPMGMGEYANYEIMGKIVNMDEGVFFLVELENGDRKHVDSRYLVQK